MPVDRYTGENDPRFWQAQYEAALGIPTHGRTWGDDWKARQFRTAALRYQLWQSGLMGTPSGITDPSFEQWMGYNPIAGAEGGTARLQPYWLDQLGAKDPDAQRAFVEQNILPDYRNVLTSEMFRGKVGGPSWLRDLRTEYEFAEPATRAWDLETRGGLRDRETYLDVLRRKYGWGLPVYAGE